MKHCVCGKEHFHMVLQFKQHSSISRYQC